MFEIKMIAEIQSHMSTLLNAELMNISQRNLLF